MSDFVVFGKSIFDILKMIIDRLCQVYVTRPKGCGKSFTIAILFMMLQNNKPCLYLIPTSFQLTFQDYFLQFLKSIKRSLRTKTHIHYIKQH